MIELTRTRRGFLHIGLMTFAGLAAAPALAAVPRVKGIRSLAFHNLHTDEKLHVDYWKNGKYDRAAMAKIDHILRDHYSGDVHPMAPRLMDLLFDLRNRSGHSDHFEVISGYRSPHTNAMLARMSDGVAKSSYHMKGMAIDIRMPGVALKRLYSTALTMKRGGAGYYPESDFVHVDVGPVRRW